MFAHTPCFLCASGFVIKRPVSKTRADQSAAKLPASRLMRIRCVHWPCSSEWLWMFAIMVINLFFSSWFIISQRRFCSTALVMLSEKLQALVFLLVYPYWYIPTGITSSLIVSCTISWHPLFRQLSDYLVRTTLPYLLKSKLGSSPMHQPRRRDQEMSN